jgi:hypothetical protein
MYNEQCETNNRYRVRFEGLSVMTMNNAISLDVVLCGSHRNRRFRRTYRLHHQGEKNQRAR